MDWLKFYDPNHKTIHTGCPIKGYKMYMKGETDAKGGHTEITLPKARK